MRRRARSPKRSSPPARPIRRHYTPPCRSAVQSALTPTRRHTHRTRRPHTVAMQFYASPEQIMRDRSEFARKMIARGRNVVVMSYSGGVLFVTENPSKALHKVSEIYDRIGFAAVGRYNEFENLRAAGVRMADLRGYSYDRRDVTGRAIATAFAQTLGSIFTVETKPYDVRICLSDGTPT